MPSTVPPPPLRRRLLLALTALVLTAGLLVATTPPAAYAEGRDGARSSQTAERTSRGDRTVRKQDRQRKAGKDGRSGKKNKTKGKTKNKTKKKTKKKRNRFRLRNGVVFNHPMGGGPARSRINDRIADAIWHARPGSVIHATAWNFDSPRLVRVLKRAHRRGVAVRLVMSKNVAHAQGKHKPYWRLKRALRKGRTPSWVRTCASSCRGFSGISHSKFVLLSRTGRYRHVVMNGSGNLTSFAASKQWNDLYVRHGNKRLWKVFRNVFREMAHDKRLRRPWRVRTLSKNLAVYVWPRQGPNAPRRDPVLSRLDHVRCYGATNTRNGRTRIRVAQTAILDHRGVLIAKRLKQLHDWGCNVRVVYAVSRPRVMKHLEARGGRGPVPLRRASRDEDGDLAYDRYLHMKSLTIRGRKGNDRSAWLTWNGSQNWTKVTGNSDEIELRISNRRVATRYEHWVNRLFRNPWDW